MGVVVETAKLVETVAYSLVAGVGITLAFSISIWALARFGDFTRNERPLAAAAAALSFGLALALSVAGLALGIIAVTDR